ncbi:flagellar basal body rod protein FlgC [Pseudomarimonas salicorniae]|uniref:Flagellar basal-body rod protein FlgC n=1 Tax=Pseudomarimonas salicorniae TaxID=2933270 RepID=A0ABT0GMC4_9GAMM|nr:flagellar basal body rod protein FlgC [Lysobacter sp. CAU 1642]MCK7595170.1 flagellar basal body rod protein FlgC [Lysobacter sp. CAU 1642]
MSMTIFQLVGSAMHAQSTRLNTVASNLANAETVATDPKDVYRQRDPVFQSVAVGQDPAIQGVRVTGVAESAAAPIKRYEPGHPLADPEGYVYAPNIDAVAQMVNMISAARSYQANVEMLNTAKELALATINIGR